MDDHDIDDVAEDADLARLLRHRADELAGPIDLDAAFADVQARARVRRGWRLAARTIAAAAAAAVLVFGFVAIGRSDREIVGPAEPIATTAPLTTSPVTTVPIAPTVPSVTPAPGPPGSTPTTTAPSAPATDEPTTFESRGGAITVRVVDGRLALDGAPTPSSGWTASVHDDGPTRVRVRFERGDERAEIRVDLQDGQLVERIVDE